MKIPALCLAVSIPVLAFAQPVGQMPAIDQPPKPKPFQPVLAKDHTGLGRIGVRLAFVKGTNLPQIVGMVRGGPAADYGFCIGDVIIKIDKNFTNSLSEDEIKLALHGEAGSGVELTVQRGDDPRLIVHAIERRLLPATSEDIVTPALIEGKL